MITYHEDTIAAQATPAGQGALAIIRLSGPDSFILVDKIFVGNTKLSQGKSHRIYYGKIAFENEDIDDVLVSIFRAPHSFTGEDSVEISAHGSSLIVQKIIEALLFYGARLAEPGEFTKRAFLNGKMDLAQAEAVADVIASRTLASLKGARNQLDGLLSSKVGMLRDSMMDLSSFLELDLDFSEDDIELISSAEVLKKISELKSEISSLIGTYNFGKVLRDGVNVALVGRPNVGKSSLLNYLLKENRAIVSEIPGTTRDVIREELSIDGILFRFHDTAGLRQTGDQIEMEGVLRSKEEIKNADLVLFLSDSLVGFDYGLFQRVLELTDPGRIINAINKIDLLDNDEYADAIKISVKTGFGMDRLLSALKARVASQNTFSEKTALVSNIRHYNALKSSYESLCLAESSVNKGYTEEFVSPDIRSAIDALDEILGKITSEEVLNNIFSKFCIGK